MVGAIATLAASLTVKSGGDSLRLDPGTELRAKVEASLPNNVLRLSVGKATVEVRASGPLPQGTELTLKVSGEPGRPQIQLLPDARPQGTPPSSNPVGNTPANTVPPTSSPSAGGAPAQGAPPVPAGGQAAGSVITPETTRQLLQTVARPPASGSAAAGGASQAGSSNTATSTAAVRSDLAARAVQTASAPPPAGGQGATATPQSSAGRPVPTAVQPPQSASTQSAAPQSVAAQSGAPAAPTGGAGAGPTLPASAPPPQGAPSQPSVPTQAPQPVQTPGAPAQTAGVTTQTATGPAPGGSAPTALPAGTGTPLPANLQAQALGSGTPSGGPAQASAPAQVAPAQTAQAPGTPLQSAQTPTTPNPTNPQPASPQATPAPAGPGQPVSATAAPGSTGTAQPLPGQAAQPAPQQGTPAAPTPTAAPPTGGTPPPVVSSRQGTPVQPQAPTQTATGQTAPPPAQAPASPSASQAGAAAPAAASGSPSAPTAGKAPAPAFSLPAGSSAPSSGPSSPAGLPAGAYSGARALPVQGADSQSRPITPQMQKAMDVVLPRLSEQQAGLSGVFAQIGTLMGGQSPAGANLPEPVKQVMQQILGLRLQPQSEGFSGKSVEAAVKNAGLMREAALLGGARAGGTPPPGGDLKSLLMNLKGLLSDLVARPAPLKPLVQPAIPSLKRGPQGERPASSSSILADGDEKALLSRLAQDTDAALSRIRMTQLVNRGLAGDDPAVQGRAMDVTVELPVSVGEQTAVLQMQIGRDPHQEGADEEGEGAWRLRFALDLEETGPMEAAVSLRGGGTFVSLWIDRGETLEAFNANKESLEASFAHAGLDLRELRFLRGLPRRTEARFGAVVDRQS